MDFTLRVIFAGLCAYVPRGEDDDHLERIDVLLVDASQDLETAEYSRITHAPVLRFALKNLVGTNEIEGPVDGFWYFRNEDVNFFIEAGGKELPLSGAVSMKKTGHRPGTDKPQNDKGDQDLRDQQTDIYWLPEMARILPEAAEVDPQSLGPNPSDTVAARIHLQKGLLRSDKLAAYDDDYIVAQFSPAYDEKSPCSHALAHWVGMDVQVEQADALVLRAVRYDGMKRRKLTLRPAGTETEVEVWIYNLCCGYHPDPDQPRLGVRPEPDQDFLFLYQISEEYQETEDWVWPIPVPTKYPVWKRNREAGGVHGIQCNGARFKTTSLTDEAEDGAEKPTEPTEEKEP